MGVRTAETMTGVVLSDTEFPGMGQAGKIGGRAVRRQGGRGESERKVKVCRYSG